MRIARLLTLLSLAAASFAALPAVALAGPGPTPAEVQAAVGRAQRSPRLWGTINICGGRSGTVLGIRGQIPALGFDAQLQMYFGVDYWDAAQSRFRRLPGVDQRVALGTRSQGLYQGGVRLIFSPHTGLLRGRIRFVWSRGGHVIGATMRLTRGGHHDAHFGNPQGYSAATCRIV